MEVKDGVFTSDATRVEQLRFSRNASHHQTGSHNGFERMEYNNYTDMSALPGFHNGLIYSDMPEDDEMDTEVKRLSSFKNWPSSSPIKPKDLAAAGFYFVGRDDQVRCFRCDLTLRRWESCDVPWEEHKLNRPMCPFVQEHEERGHHNITCQSVEVAGGSERPKISFPGKEVYASQVGYPGTSGFSSSAYPANFHPSPSGPFYRQNMRYESLENSLEPGYNYPNASQLSYGRESQLERNNSIYNSEEYYMTRSARQGAMSQIYPQEKNNLPSSQNTESYFNERTTKQGQVHPVGVTQNPSFRYPSQRHQNYSIANSGLEEYSYPRNTELELAKETYSYSLPAGSTVQVCQEKGGAKQVYVQEGSLDSTMQNKMKLDLKPPIKYPSSSTLKEQQWFPAKDPGHEKLMKESHEYKVQRQVLPSSGMGPFVSPNLQEVTSPTAQGSHWPSGQTAQATGRVVPNPSISSGTPHQGYLHQGPLYRQENIRHGSTVAELQSEHHRLTTFVDWPQNSPINPCELAAAGFYYLGNGDNVKCYKCGCGLCNWDPNDTPWGEHLKWSPNCPLVIEHFQGRSATDPVEGTEITSEKGLQSSRALPGDVLQFQQTQNKSALQYRQPEPSGQQHVHPRKIDQENSTSFSVTQGPYNRQSPSSEHAFTFTSPVTVSHPSRKSCSESLSPPATSRSPFEMTTSSQPQSLCLTSQDIDHIVEMGFSRATVDEVISTQLANTGRTFASVEELTNAVLEYGGRIVSSPTCNQTSATPPGISPTIQSPIIPAPVPTLREITSESASTMVRTLSADSHPVEQYKGELRRTHSAPLPSEGVPSGPESDEYESLEKKLERMQEERTCKICMDAEIGVVFLPCGHLVCCPNCASGVELCPMCRRPIQESVRTYMS